MKRSRKLLPGEISIGGLKEYEKRQISGFYN
jgi:hypothetical protein